MAYDFAPEFGIQFVLMSLETTEMAIFNNSSHPDCVGALTNIQGLDSPEVRESGDTIAEFDGGVQGPNFYGRRPVVLEGLVYGHADAAARNAKLAKLMRVTNAMRLDAMLAWTPSGMDESVYLSLRRQQPLKISGGWNKTFQAAMVAADPRIYSSNSYFLLTDEADDVLSPINQGNAQTYPSYTVAGPVSNPVIHNSLSGLNLAFDVDLGFDDLLYVDTLNRTVLRGTRAPGSRHNYFINPSFEGASTVFSPFTNVTSPAIVPQQSVSSGRGSSVLQLTPTLLSEDITLSKFDAIPGVAEGDTVSVSFDLWEKVAHNPTAPVDWTVMVRWNSGSGVIAEEPATEILDSEHQSDVTEWRRAKYTTNPAPAGTISADIVVTIAVQGGWNHESGQVYYMDGVVFESGLTSGEFFDGDNPESGFIGAWDGAVNGSVSHSYTTEVDGSAPLTSWYSVVDFANTRWSGLLNGPNDVYVQSDSTPETGFSFRVDWRHAWL